MNTRNRLVALPCRLAPGAFSGERVFTVVLANGEVYSSGGPRYFCWNADGNLVQKDEPTVEVDGKIAARVVDWLDNDIVVVEVPDGEHLAVRKAQVVPRPTEIKPPEPNHVPLRSGS